MESKLRVLIAGAGSYVGTAVESWLIERGYCVDTIDMRSLEWKCSDFSNYDVVLHVAGIAHDFHHNYSVDDYYRVNYNLAVETAQIMKRNGVKQFIFMSSMAIYNDTKKNKISESTQTQCRGAYGLSKLRADLALQQMNCEAFKVAILRPPVIFGPNCKGNFSRLLGLCRKIPLFPNIKNQKSMLYIDNLCIYIQYLIDNELNGVFFPQNKSYFCTSDIVRQVAEIRNKKIWITKLFNWLVYILYPFFSQLKKMFSDFVYEQSDGILDLLNFIPNEECIRLCITKSE